MNNEEDPIQTCSVWDLFCIHTKLLFKLNVKEKNTFCNLDQSVYFCSVNAKQHDQSRKNTSVHHRESCPAF